MKNKKWTILFAFFVLVIIAGIGAGAYHLLKDSSSDSRIALDQSSKNSSDSSLAAANQEEEPFTEGLIYPEDMTKSQKKTYKKALKYMDQYKDCYAYIRISDTKLSEPIVQVTSDDPYNDYYLNYTIDGKKGYPGSIYSHPVNAQDFSDFNTVLYGHNMINGTMFGDLDKYKDQDYLKKHQEIQIYTKDGLRLYKVFATVLFDKTLITQTYPEEKWLEDEDYQPYSIYCHQNLYVTTESSDEGSESPTSEEAQNQSQTEESVEESTEIVAEKTAPDFLEDIKNVKDFNSYVLDQPKVTKDDHIITLSTCVATRSDRRLLICAVMEKGEK